MFTLKECQFQQALNLLEMELRQGAQKFLLTINGRNHSPRLRRTFSASNLANHTYLSQSAIRLIFSLCIQSAISYLRHCCHSGHSFLPELPSLPFILSQVLQVAYSYYPWPSTGGITLFSYPSFPILSYFSVTFALFLLFFRVFL